MVCPCGANNETGARFCGTCGKPIPTEGVSNERLPHPVSPESPRRLRTRLRPRTTLTLIVAVALGALSYWWTNRPVGPYVVDRSGLIHFTSDDGKAGFMDPQGNVVIPAQFAGAGHFSEGLAAVTVGSKRGYVDTTGAIVINPQFEVANEFRYGRAVVKMGERFAVIDQEGRVLATFRHAQDTYFGGYLAAVSSDGTLGFANRSGKVTIRGNFTSLKYGFVHGLAPAARDGQWGFVGTAGTWVIDPQFEDVGIFSEGLAKVVVGGRTGFIGPSGRFVINPQFDAAGDFVSGVAVVKQEGRFGLVASDGRLRLAPSHQYIGDLNDDRAAFWDGAKWGYLDSSGRVVIEPQFDEGGTFQDGLAHVLVLNKKAWITTSGGFLKEPFEGRTIAQERERRAAEAEKISREAASAERRRVEEGISGTWSGMMGRGVLLTIERTSGGWTAHLLNGDWRESLELSILDDNRLRLVGTSVTQLAGSPGGSYALDTFELILSPDGSALTGGYTDVEQRRGQVSFRRLMEDRH